MFQRTLDNLVREGVRHERQEFSEFARGDKRTVKLVMGQFGQNRQKSDSPDGTRLTGSPPFVLETSERQGASPMALTSGHQPERASVRFKPGLARIIHGSGNFKDSLWNQSLTRKRRDVEADPSLARQASMRP